MKKKAARIRSAEPASMNTLWDSPVLTVDDPEEAGVGVAVAVGSVSAEVVVVSEASLAILAAPATRADASVVVVALV